MLPTEAGPAPAATMIVLASAEMISAATPANVTPTNLLPPARRPEPVMVTRVAKLPDDGDTPVISPGTR